MTPLDSLSRSVCGRSAQPSKWHFRLATGVGGEASAGRAGWCAKIRDGNITSATDYGGFTAGVRLPKSTSGSITLNATVNATWNVTLGVSGNGPGWACKIPQSLYAWSFRTWEWNNFTSFAYNDTTVIGNTTTTSTHNLAAIPSPFHLNNTTYYLNNSGTSYFSDCSAYIFGFLEMNGYLIDTTTNLVTNASSDSIGTNGTLYETELQVSNSTDWYVQTYYNWDEGTQAGNNGSFVHSSNSTSSATTVFVPSYATATSGATALTWKDASNLAGSIVFKTTLRAGDRYVLLFEVYGDVNAANSWPHGFASWTFNMASLGRGLSLASISIT